MVFIKKIAHNTEEQLRADFGDCPPKPLKAEIANLQFVVVRFGWIGKQLYLAQDLLFSFLNLCKGSYQGDHQDLLSLQAEISGAKQDMHDAFAKTSKELGVFGKFAFIGVWILLSPFLFLILLYKSTKLIRVIFRFLSSQRSTIGMFNPLSFSRSHIAIYDPLLKLFSKTGWSTDAVVSHEHVHLLQSHFFPERNLGDFNRQTTENLKNFLIDPEADLQSCSYFFQLNEMEARLHEVILSYYRERGELPADYRSFIGLLLGCGGLGQLLKIQLDNNNIAPNADVPFDFKARDKAAVIDIVGSVLKLKDGKFVLRFIMEALPVMYANLLILYGGADQAKRYLKTVDNIQFYLDLYGTPPGHLA